MTLATLTKQIKSLPANQRATLLDEIWLSLTEDQIATVSPTLLDELDRRWADYKAHPETSLNWEQAKVELDKRAKRATAKATTRPARSRIK